MHDRRYRAKEESRAHCHDLATAKAVHERADGYKTNEGADRSHADKCSELPIAYVEVLFHFWKSRNPTHDAQAKEKEKSTQHPPLRSFHLEKGTS